MKRDKHFCLGVSLLVIVLVAGCTASAGKSVKVTGIGQSAPGGASGDILARVGERTITVSEFETRFNGLSTQNRRGKTIEEQKEKAMERMVQTTLLSLEATAEKIDREEAVASAIQRIGDSILAREYYDRNIRPELTITEDEIKDYYDSHPDEFTDPEVVRARHVLISVASDAVPEEWIAAEKKAHELKKEIDNGADFEKLAKEKSDDKRTKRRGGTLGFTTRGNMPEGFPDLLFSLNEGDVSDPVKGSKGYHIIKVESKGPKKIRTLDQVQRDVKRKLEKQKRDELFAQTIERLKERYKVELNAELLASVKVEEKKAGGG